MCEYLQQIDLQNKSSYFYPEFSDSEPDIYGIVSPTFTLCIVFYFFIYLCVSFVPLSVGNYIFFFFGFGFEK